MYTTLNPPGPYIRGGIAPPFPPLFFFSHDGAKVIRPGMSPSYNLFSGNTRFTRYPVVGETKPLLQYRMADPPKGETKVPTIAVEKDYPHPLDRVFAAAQNTEELAKHIPSLTRIEILEQGPDLVKARWFGKVVAMGMTRDVKWVEVDRWDSAGKVCRFEQTSGDFKLYRGTWAFAPKNGGTKSTLTIEYDLGLPIGGPLVERMIANVVKNNATEFLNGLGKLLTAP